MGSIEGREADERPQSSGSWSCVKDDEFDALQVLSSPHVNCLLLTNHVFRSIVFKAKPIEKYPGLYQLSLRMPYLYCNNADIR